jgi:hypothetical protein
VRLGKCRRYTEIEGKQSRRTIIFSDCSIIFSDLKGEGQPARGDEVEISIQEKDSEREVCGRFDTLDLLSLGLPPVQFAELWAAGAAVDGAARHLTIRFKSDEAVDRIATSHLGEIMPVCLHLVEYMGLHPVVAELRDIQRRLADNWGGAWRGALIGVSVLAASLLVTELAAAAFRALWKLVQP